MGANTSIYIFGGEPFPEERFINWNFVSSSKERIEQAKADWKAQRFPKVLGETTFVPYPEIHIYKQYFVLAIIPEIL
jgi:hypothetical protein